MTEPDEGAQGVLGCVDRFTSRSVTGWVVGPADRLPVRVGLHLDDVEVAGAWTAEPSTANTWGDARSFRFPVRDLWSFCTDQSRITVRVDGRPLPIAGKGAFKHPSATGSRTMDELREKLAAGYVFNRRGDLSLSKRLDTQWQAAVVGLYEQVREIVTARTGYDTFVMYGTLLGQVRDQDFIGHDDDFDAAYLSTSRDPEQVLREHREILLDLIDAGLDVEVKRTALHIRRPDDAARIDLFHVYFGEDGELRLPFGHAGRTSLTADSWQGTVEAPMADGTVLVPVNGEDWVEHLYGESWRTPVPGFSWSLERVAQDSKARIRPGVREEGYWANFYARNEYTSGSTFFEFVRGRDVPRTVLDIGCGDGRDSLAFAASGCTVTGLDRSTVGVRNAAAKADAQGLAESAIFRVCDVGDVDQVRTVLEEGRRRGGGGNVLFYLRFFLHSIPEEVQEALLGNLASLAVPGDVLAAEFRTAADADKKHVHESHYRRYQDGGEFVAALSERYGFDVGYQHEGTGLSPYGDEDPVLIRVLATRRPDDAAAAPVPADAGVSVLERARTALGPRARVTAVRRARRVLGPRVPEPVRRTLRPVTRRLPR